MLFNKDIKKLKQEAKKENTVIDNIKELSEEEILNSNNIELIANYAKKYKSKIAIEKVRGLLELARSLGVEIVENMMLSFQEIDNRESDRSFNKTKLHYLFFEDTRHGKLALEGIKKMPEPFKTKAKQMLENYRNELRFNVSLFNKKKRSAKLIWEKIFGFEYLGEKDSLSVNLSPLSFEFNVKDKDSFDKAYSSNVFNKPSPTIGGFSSSDRHSLLIKDTQPISMKDKSFKNASRQERQNVLLNKKRLQTTLHHERQHELYDLVNPIDRKDFSLDLNKKFNSISESLNNVVREMFEENLKYAKNEIFAIVKGETGSRSEEDKFLDMIFYNDGNFLNSMKQEKFNHMKKNYDYNENLRRKILLNIDDNKNLLNDEKNKLEDAVIFFQSEYDRVLKNMIDIVFDKKVSVEYLTNVPIREWYKFSDKKYTRTDFLIKQYQF